MSTPTPVRACVAALVLTLATGLGGCGADDDPTASSAGESSPTTEATTAEPSPTESSPTETGAPPPDDGQPFGPACDRLFPARGNGSIADAKTKPFALLAVATQEISHYWGRFGVHTEFEQPHFELKKEATIFVPRNAGFDALSREALQPYIVDPKYQKAVVRRHVVPGRLAPSELAGDHTTLGGGTLTIEVDGEDVRVSSEESYKDASVVCGNVPTLDATVYVIDNPLLHVWMGMSAG